MQTADSFEYEGSELALFQHAVHWKRYFGRHLERWVRGAVLEVGAGIGGTMPALWNDRVEHWTALEPDPAMHEELRRAAVERGERATAVVGTLATLAAEDQFDCILYIDVLEHIEDDRSELRGAAAHLRPGGALVVLAPAHGWLYTPFDRAIGHHRRYSRRSLAAVAPDGLRLDKLFYLDSVGMLASLANRLLLRSAMPTAGQIRFWDSVLVRLSRVGDPLTFYRLGKTVVAAWSRP